MRRTVAFTVFALINMSLLCQTYPGKYLIWFRDKSHNDYSLSDPARFLSQRALDRRKRSSIAIDSRDLPVSNFYLDSLRKLGISILNSSKWFNNCTVAITDTNVFAILRGVSFLDMSKTDLSNNSYPLKYKYISEKFPETVQENFPDSIYGKSLLQIELENGLALHRQGFKGDGIQIAVLDAGFSGADSVPVFDSLRNNGQILGTRDFVSGGTNVYYQHPHGTGVLSLMGGNNPGTFIGTAPHASFWLLRTEDANTEYIIEEDNWVSAAEFADSAGADIITTSLGYTQFNNPEQNHSYKDMNGISTRISIAADIAFSKGILVVASAGNDGISAWHYISAPADAINIIAVGAVNSSGIIAPFSSRGPSFDGRVKPNLVAMGWNVTVAIPNGNFSIGSGTSYSAPIIAGLAASLWQAYPGTTNAQVKTAIEQSCSQFSNPDSTYGYGIPDFQRALDNLHALSRKAVDPSIVAYPDPFSEKLSVKILEPIVDKQVLIVIFDVSGKVVIESREDVSGTLSGDLSITGSEFLSKGIYIIKIVSSTKEFRTKIIKL